MADRKAKLIERIKALMAKTTEAGCTEGEALAAMQKARELMDKYQIDSADLASGGEECEKHYSNRDWDNPYDIRWRIASWVMLYCDCKCWGREGGTITYFGLSTDAQFATWLSDMLNDFCNREAARQFGYSERSARTWKAKRRADFDAYDLFGGVNSEHLRASFVQGFCDRINQRLKELYYERQRTQKMSDGRSLVVVKNALVEEAFKALGLKLGNGRGGRRYEADPRAYGYGSDAGNRANFSRPVEGSSGPRLIGG
jgi:hypothetical protein